MSVAPGGRSTGEHARSAAPQRARTPRKSTLRRGSLKRTLLLWLLLPLSIILPVRDWFAHELALQHTRDAFDHSLLNTAEALAALSSIANGTVKLEISPRLDVSLRTDRYDKVFYTALDADGRLVAGDAELAAAQMAPPHPVKPGERLVYDAVMQGTPVRVAARTLECGSPACQVRVAETLHKRERLSAEALRVRVLFFGALVVMLGVCVWWAVVSALRPLQALRDQMARRSLDALPPLDAGLVPAEVHPLVNAINELFARLSASARAQQAFIADAAHQLRTPLTTMRTEAELALLEPHPATLQPTLTRLHQAAERAARLADQLLALARTEAAMRQAPRREAFDLKAVAQQAVQDWVPRAVQRGVDLGFQLDSAPVHGQSHLVRELLANLIHNALEYTPPYAQERSRVTVRTRMQNGAAVIEVEDNGPGIPLAEQELVFERFHRGAGAPGSGSGLGLAIVRDIAMAHGARVELGAGDEGGGLVVRVVWPRAA